MQSEGPRPATITVGLPFSDQPLSQVSLAYQSVQKQSYQDWALILLADGATPDLLNWAKQIQDPRVTLFEQKSRGGLARRLNEIARAATSPYLARMDADDVMHPDRLQRIVSELDADPALDVIGSRAYMIDESNVVVGAFAEPPLPREPRGYLYSNAFTHPTVAGRTEWFRENPYDETLHRCQDKELWLRTNSSSKFLKLNDRLLYYRVSRQLTPQKQATSAMYDRLILRQGASSLVGRLELARLLSRSYVRQILFGVLVLAGQGPRVYKRKSSPLGEQELFDAVETLRALTDSATTVARHP